MSNEQLWLSVGFVGQAFFSMRFLVQWIASEKRQESVIPLSFWFFSIGGGLTLLTYALHRLDPVFILGEGAGILPGRLPFILRSGAIRGVRLLHRYVRASTPGGFP